MKYINMKNISEPVLYYFHLSKEVESVHQYLYFQWRKGCLDFWHLRWSLEICSQMKTWTVFVSKDLSQAVTVTVYSVGLFSQSSESLQSLSLSLILSHLLNLVSDLILGQINSSVQRESCRESLCSRTRRLPAVWVSCRNAMNVNGAFAQFSPH